MSFLTSTAFYRKSWPNDKPHKAVANSGKNSYFGMCSAMVILGFLGTLFMTLFLFLSCWITATLSRDCGFGLSSFSTSVEPRGLLPIGYPVDGQNDLSFQFTNVFVQKDCHIPHLLYGALESLLFTSIIYLRIQEKVDLGFLFLP